MTVQCLHYILCAASLHRYHIFVNLTNESRLPEHGQGKAKKLECVFGFILVYPWSIWDFGDKHFKQTFGQSNNRM